MYCQRCTVLVMVAESSSIPKTPIYDRRVLCSEAGRVVRETWEEIMSSKLSL